ncbi:MAG: hypothetical protein HFJ89_02040 [Oscillospiraceae bacterium]|jgi:hypothetical protein|nr:hypothetical protein [Oscillospiraceae bacterium]
MENEKIVVMQKKSILLMCIICLIFSCGFMIWLVFNLETGSGGALTEQLFSTPVGVAAGKVLFAVCAVVCLYAAVILTKRFINPKPLIIADESGLTDNSSDIGFVPWRDVKRIYMVIMKHNKLIQVELECPEKYLYRLSGLSRKAVGLNIKMGYQAISFSLNGTGNNPDKFLAELIKLWERNR